MLFWFAFFFFKLIDKKQISLTMASNATIMFYKLAFSCDKAESDIFTVPPSMIYIDLRVCVCEYQLS